MIVFEGNQIKALDLKRLSSKVIYTFKTERVGQVYYAENELNCQQCGSEWDGHATTVYHGMEVLFEKNEIVVAVDKNIKVIRFE